MIFRRAAASRPPRAATLGLLLFSVLVVLGAAFQTLLDDVTESVPEHDELTALDTRVSDVVIGFRQPWLSHVFEVVTWAGSMAVLVPLLALVGLRMRRSTGSWHPLIFLGIGLLGAVTVSTLVKLVVARPRPPAFLALVHAAGFAFPSGHSTAAAAGWLSLSVVLTMRTRRRGLGAVLVGSALLIAGLVGLSRVYLGVHEPTDVLAGWSLGALWVVTVLVIVLVLDALSRRQDGDQRKGVRSWRAGSSGSTAAARSPTSSPADRTDPWSPGS